MSGTGSGTGSGLGDDTRRVLPPEVAQRAREFAAAGRTAVPARGASTVILLRDTPGGIEVYVHVRHATMAFAAGMVAFPGGGVDSVDLVPPLPDENAWARALGCGTQAARGFVHAALRETEEETGVVLAAGDLVPYAHWITPRFETRRYDTWFFLAALPPGAQPADVSGEASSVTWVRPADALERSRSGEWAMLPPTQFVLEALRSAGSAGAAVSAASAAADGREIAAVTPGWLDDGERVWALLPDDADYPGYPGDDQGAT